MIDILPQITECASDFTGREWVFQAIEDWLATPAGSRVFLLTGGSVSGKSTVVTRLAQIGLGQAPPDALTPLGKRD